MLNCPKPIKFKKHELTSLLHEGLGGLIPSIPGFGGVDWSDIFKQLSMKKVAPQLAKQFKAGKLNPKDTQGWETDPKTGEVTAPMGERIASWLSTPPERRIPSIIGSIGQSGFSPEAAQDYMKYYKGLYQGVASPITSKISGLIPTSITAPLLGTVNTGATAKALTSLVDPDVENQLPLYAAAARFDPRILAGKV